MISDKGLALIKGYEKFIPYVYDDLDPRREWKGGKPRGTLTIGYGHTRPPMWQGLRITEEKALVLLESDLAPAEAMVIKLVKPALTQGQYDALVSFVFNTGRLSGTTLLRKLNAKDYAGARAEFAKWNRSKGKMLLGLVRRRAAEVALWDGK